MARTPKPADYRARMTAPERLDDRAAIVWKRTVKSVSTDHFAQCDAPLLVEYCRAIVLADQAADALTRDGAVVGDKVNPWIIVQEKAVRAVTALSGKLRLSPLSRFDRLKAGTNSRDQNTALDDDDPDGLLAKPFTRLAHFRGR